MRLRRSTHCGGCGGSGGLWRGRRCTVPITHVLLLLEDDEEEDDDPVEVDVVGRETDMSNGCVV